jgi:hypothetical protein
MSPVQTHPGLSGQQLVHVSDGDGDGLSDGDAFSVYSNISDINFNISSLELEPINYNLIKITLDLDYRI